MYSMYGDLGDLCIPSLLVNLDSQVSLSFLQLWGSECVKEAAYVLYYYSTF